MLWGVTESSCSSSFGDLKCLKESAQSASAIIWQRKQGFAFTKVIFSPCNCFSLTPCIRFFDRRCLNLDPEQTRLCVFTRTWIIHSRNGALTHITHPRVVVWPFDTFIGRLLAFFHSLSPKRWVNSDASAFRSEIPVVLIKAEKTKSSVWNCWSHLSDFAVAKLLCWKGNQTITSLHLHSDVQVLMSERAKSTMLHSLSGWI